MSAVTYVVVFGLDGEGRPRAACFAEHDAALAIKAARVISATARYQSSIPDSLRCYRAAMSLPPGMSLPDASAGRFSKSS